MPDIDGEVTIPVKLLWQALLAINAAASCVPADVTDTYARLGDQLRAIVNPPCQSDVSEMELQQAREWIASQCR